MSNTNSGGPAFPHPHSIYQSGMTLRDYFAAKAMQAYLTHEAATNLQESTVAEWAYATADAMLRARSNT